MKNFFQKNKALLTILISAVVIVGVVWLAVRNTNWVQSDAGDLNNVIGDIVNNFIGNNVDDADADCSNIPTLKDNEIKKIIGVIDGDTVVIEGGYSVRLLGIDTAEIGEPCYDIAKNRLTELVLNKSVRLEQGEEDLDKYCRYLRYVFLDDENINLTMVEECLAEAFFYSENVKYRAEIEEAEQMARDSGVGCESTSH